MGKRLAILIVTLVFLSLCPVFSKDVLTIGYFDFPPYLYDEAGEPKGVATDIVKEVFFRMDQPVEFVYLPWSRILRRLDIGDVDVAFEVLYKVEREAFIDYGREEIIVEATSLFALKEDEIEFDGDYGYFRGKSVGVLQDFVYGEEFDEVLSSGLFYRIEKLYDLNCMILMLLSRRIDLMAGDSKGLKHILRDKGTLDLVEELAVIEETPTYMAFSKRNDLRGIRDDFDRVLRNMKSDGTYKIIIDSYDFLFSDDE